MTESLALPRELPRRGALPCALVLVVLLQASIYRELATAGEPLSGGDIAVVGARLHLGDGRVLPDGSVVIRNGKITAIGERSKITVPAGVEVIDAAGFHVMPGLVELQSRLFLDPGDLLAVGRPEGRSAAEALTPFEDTWEAVRDEGVTTVAISLGASRGVGGLGAVLKLRQADPAGEGSSSFLLEIDSHYTLALGVTGSLSTSARRLQQYYELRSLFVAARQYRELWDEYWKAVDKYNKDVAAYLEARKKAPPAGKPGSPKPGPTPPKPGSTPPKPPPPKPAPSKPTPAKPPPPKKSPPKPAPKLPAKPKRPAMDVGKEALLRAMAGKLPVLVEAHRPDDVEYACQLQEEFGLDLAIVGGTAARKHAARLAASEIPVALEPVLLRTRALEYEDHSERSARSLKEAGVRVAIASSLQGAVLASASRIQARTRLQREILGASRYLRFQAAAAVRGGLSRQHGLSAITLEPARILGIDDRVGSLEEGKHGDLVILDGEPLDARSRVLQVVVEGIPGARRDPGAPATWRVRPRAAGESQPVDIRPDAPGSVIRGVTVATPRCEDVDIIENASVVISDGRIVSVLPADADLPESLQVHDLPGRWLLPGFIDAHSHVALDGETDDISRAVTEDLRVEDAFDPWSEEVEIFLRQGVTTVALSPGQGNVVGGRINLVKLVPGRLPLRVLVASEQGVALKASLNPVSSRARYPTSASGATERLERWLREKREESAGKTGESVIPPILVVQVEWAAQAERILRSFPGSGLRPVFLEGVVPDARTWESLDGAASVILRPYSLGEAVLALRSAATLEKKGVPFALSTSYTRPDYPFYRTVTRRDLLTTSVLSIQHGLSIEGALRALTSTPAAILGLENRLGTVQAGADADLVVWSGDPFSLNAAVEVVFIDGQVVFQRVLEVPPEAVASATGRSAVVEPGASDTKAGVVRAVAAAGATGLVRGTAATGDPGTLVPALTSQTEDGARVILVRADRVFPVSGPAIDKGQVVVRDGKIVEVGAQVSVSEATEGVLVLEVAGSLVPGFIDGGSDLAVRGPAAEEFRELTPAHPVMDAIDLSDSDLRRALHAGVTSATVTPGARNVIGGLGSIIRTSASSRRLGLLGENAFLCISLTPEAHRGNASLRFGQPRSFRYRIPTTRMGTVFLARRAFFEAQIEDPGESSVASGLNPMLGRHERRVLQDVLSGKLTARFRADTRAEILTAMRIAEEFEFPLQIEGGREALRLIDRLVERKVGLFLESDARWGREIRSSKDVSARLPAELAAAGVPFAFFSVRSSEVPHLRERVIWSVRQGLPAAVALEAITLQAARLLGVADRVGSIESGKDADLVAIGGDPFSSSAPVLWVMAGGRVHRPPPPDESTSNGEVGAATTGTSARPPEKIFAPGGTSRKRRKL